MANLFEICLLVLDQTKVDIPREAIVEVSLFWKGARPPYTARRGCPPDVESLRPLPKQVLQHVTLAVGDGAG